MGKIEESVRPIAEKAALELGYELYDIEYKKEGSEWYLRIFIDKPEGMGVDDCEKYSRHISPLLDESDPVPDNYILEISSPGMFRKLKTPEHFKRYMGEQVEVKLYKSQDGRKKFNGVLKGFSDGDVTVEENGETFTVKSGDYMYVKLNPMCF